MLRIALKDWDGTVEGLGFRPDKQILNLLSQMDSLRSRMNDAMAPYKASLDDKTRDGREAIEAANLAKQTEPVLTGEIERDELAEIEYILNNPDEYEQRINAEYQSQIEEVKAEYQRQMEEVEELEADHRRNVDNMVDNWLRNDDTRDTVSTFQYEKYPLMSADPRDQSRANRAFNDVVESYRDHHEGLTYGDLAGRLGTTDESLRKYRRAPQTVSRVVAERLCELASITMDELRGLGDPYNRILMDGTTTDALLSAELLSAEHVGELYKLVDDKTKKAVTFAIQSWVSQMMLEDRLARIRGRDYFLKEGLRRRLSG